MALHLEEMEFGKTLFFGIGSGKIFDDSENVRGIQFHSHIMKDHVRFYRAPENNRNLVVRIGKDGDQIYLKNFFDKHTEKPISFAPLFYLADGSTVRVAC